MSKAPTVCRHGHTGWMYQRLTFDKKHEKHYWVWVCRECARLRNLEISRRRRGRPKHRMADAWRDCVVECQCGAQFAERSMVRAKAAWRAHKAEQHK